MKVITPEQHEWHERLVCETITEQAGWHVDRFDTRRFDDTTQRNLHHRRRESHLRHLPDLIATHRSGRHVLIECKSTTPKHVNSPNYTIEIASLNACMRWAQMSVPVLVVWHDLSASRPHAVRFLRSTREGPYYGVGSGDRYFLVDRHDLRQVSQSLPNYLNRITDGTFNKPDRPTLFESNP